MVGSCIPFLFPQNYLSVARKLLICDIIINYIYFQFLYVIHLFNESCFHIAYGHERKLFYVPLPL